MTKLEATSRWRIATRPSRPEHLTRNGRAAPQSAKAFVSLVLVVALLGSSACVKRSGVSGTSSTSLVSTLSPLRLALVTDQTGSMVGAEQLKLEDVQGAVEIVKERGGDVLVLVIRSNSAKTPGPSLHIDPPQAIPVKPTSSDDVFDAADAAERHRRAVAAYDDRNRERLAGTEADVSQFMTEVETLLHLKIDRLATDVGYAHARAGRFFDDPDIPGQAPAERVLLAVSDGEDTAGLVPVKKFSRPVTVLLVTPSGPGAFAIDKPIVFSSVPTAIRYMRQGGK